LLSLCTSDIGLVEETVALLMPMLWMADLKAMIPRFLTVAARTPPMPSRLLKMAEPYA